MTFPTPHTHEDRAGADASSSGWITGRNFSCGDGIFAFFFLRYKFVIVSLKKNLEHGTHQGALISNNRCLMQRTEVGRLWAFLNVRPGSRMTDRQTQRDWQSRTFELVLESRPDSVANGLPVTWAGALLSPFSVARALCLSEILEIQSGFSGQCPSWTWCTPRIPPAASPLVNWVIYLGGPLALRWSSYLSHWACPLWMSGLRE